MSQAIRKLYTSAGLKPPKGKGIHTKKFHSCVVICKVKKKKSKKPRSCHAVCMKSIGKKRAVRKMHRR